jgi:hypothetical protein
MYAGENFSPDGNYLMISTIQKTIFIHSSPESFQKTVIYDKDGKEVKVLNEVALNEIIPKVLWRRVLVKEI